jgi:metal-responsive CopG/Arc/MetJ family transcriptional regulator
VPDVSSERDKRQRKPDPGMVRFQVWLPQAWLERLQELARERAVSMSDVVRILLRENLYDRERRPPE